MNKIAGYGLLALFLIAATITAMAPSAEESCCQKICRKHKADKLNFRIHYTDDDSCCKKESCDKK